MASSEYWKRQGIDGYAQRQNNERLSLKISAIKKPKNHLEYRGPCYNKVESRIKGRPENKKKMLFQNKYCV